MKKFYITCLIFISTLIAAEVDMSRVVFSKFEAGHMMYNHQPSFDRFLKEVNEFISK